MGAERLLLEDVGRERRDDQQTGKWPRENKENPRQNKGIPRTKQLTKNKIKENKRKGIFKECVKKE